MPTYYSNHVREITNGIWMPWLAIKGYTARVIEPIHCIILLLTYGSNKKNDILLPQHTVFKNNVKFIA